MVFVPNSYLRESVITHFMQIGSTFINPKIEGGK